MLFLNTPPVFAAEDEAGASAPANKTAATETEPALEQPGADYSLEAVLKAARANLQESLAEIKQREAKFAERKEEARQRLNRAEAKMTALENEAASLESSFEANRIDLDNKAKLLSDKLGALKELFGVFQQNASDLIGAFNGSPTSLQYPNRDGWLEGFANRMKNASEVSSVDDIMGLWYEMQREITALGDIVRLRTNVATSNGEAFERDLVRIGGFSLITQDPEPAYLFWSDAGNEVVATRRKSEDAYLGQIGSYLNADSGLQAVSVDPTGGALTALLLQKPTLEERIHQGGLVGYIILALGGLALLLAAYKLFDIAVISLRVQAQQRKLNQPRGDNVLGQLLLVYQNNRHADSETLEMRLHETVDKGALRVKRFAIFLAIIAAVAPLLGLLGTVVGMINTFQAITLYGTGDPQTMAGGISQALITTVMGLVVAVPAVLLHAVVSGRAKAVINVLHQQIAALTGDRIEQEHGKSTDAKPRKDNFGAGPRPAPA